MTPVSLDRSRFSRRGGTPKCVYENAGSGYFYTGRKEEYDLTNVRIINNMVDTVRQLYAGTPDPRLVAQLQTDYESAFQPQVIYFDNSFVLNGGSSGGFRFMLINKELGLVIHLFNRHVKAIDSEASPHDYPESTHLKIECSPHLLLSHTVAEVQELLDDIATQVFTGGIFEPVGCAVHLAADIAGIGAHLPENFRERFITLSSIRDQRSTVDTFDHATNIVEYGRAKSILYGEPRSTQFNFYNKSEQALANDKLDFWQNIWLQRKDQHGQPIYQIGEPVMRVEWRIHHSNLLQFIPASAQEYAQTDNIPLCDAKTGEIICLGTLKQYKLGQTTYQHAQVDLTNATEFRPLTTYFQASQYLDSIWQYCLKRFRLHLRSKSRYIDPLWTVLRDDISWETQPIIFKRNYTKKSEGVEKNIGLFIGNGLTLAARMGWGVGVNRITTQVLKFLRKSIFWKTIFFHYFKKCCYSEYIAYKKLILHSGFLKEPSDWASYVGKSTFDQVVCYIRDEVIGLGIKKRILIGRAAV